MPDCSISSIYYYIHRHMIHYNYKISYRNTKYHYAIEWNAVLLVFIIQKRTT